MSKCKWCEREISLTEIEYLRDHNYDLNVCMNCQYIEALRKLNWREIS
jgi:hypothetical protein